MGDAASLAILGVCGIVALVLTAVAAKGWQGDRFLCETCKYNDAEQCHKAERPQALICMAYKPQEISNSAN